MKKLMFLINEAAKNWERTRDPKYKEEWYRLLNIYHNQFIAWPDLYFCILSYTKQGKVKMTDISKYKSVALSHDSTAKLDKIRKVIVEDTIVSRAQCLNILINEKVRKLNGKLQNKTGK